MCTDTQAALNACVSQAVCGSQLKLSQFVQPTHAHSTALVLFDRQEGKDKFPEACADLAVTHLECAVAKREFAYETAAQLVGKDAVNQVLPKYEESMKKASELIGVYKENVAGGKQKEAFWGQIYSIAATR